MSVHLVPYGKLRFHGPFTEPIERTLTITNENATPVAYKVKTIAPRLYAVRPSIGRIEPGNSVDLTVKRIATKEQPSLSAGSRDKFLIQSIFIRPESTKDLQSLWNVPHDAGDEWKIHSQKLFAMFPPFEEGENAGSDVCFDDPALLCITRYESNVEESSMEADLTGSEHLLSGLPRFTRSKTPWESSSAPASPPRTPPLSRQSDSSDRDESRNESRQPPGPDSVNAKPLSPVPDPTALGKQDLEQQLSDAQEEIKYLHALLARSGDNISSATDADGRTHTSTPKSFASGVESMMAALSDFMHPFMSSEPPKAATIDSLVSDSETLDQLLEGSRR